jgi:hypothetical protein
MGRRKLNGADVPTPGPWCVCGEAGYGASPEVAALGVAPATEGQPGGWPYLIRQDRPLTPGSSGFHIAVGIQRLADAKLIAAAPDLTAVLLRLVTAPDVRARDLDPRTHEAVAAAWDLLVKVAPHLEIGP